MNNMVRMPLLPIVVAEIVVGVVTMLVLTRDQMVSDDWTPVVTVCLLGFAFCCASVIVIWRNDWRAVLYDAFFYMKVASAVYFFLGPLVYVFGPEPVVAEATAFYPASAAAIVWLTGIHLIAVGITGVAYISVKFEHLYRWSLAVSQSYARVSFTSVLLVLLVVCLAIKYLFILPAGFEPVSWAIAAPLVFAQQFVSFALYIIFARIAAGQRAWWPWAIALLLTEVGTGLVTFNKTTAISAALFAGLGWFSKRLNWKAMIGAGIGLAIMLEVLSPLVAYGREAIWERGFGLGSFEDRLQVLRSYVVETKLKERGAPTWGVSWGRLNYIPIQKAAVDFYDAGDGGDDWQLMLWLIVPRILYPDKPIITEGGPLLFRKITGATGTSVSAGLFIDAYYNVGTVGIFVIAILFGWSLALYSAIGKGVIRGGSDLMYPLVAFGIFRGLRVDGAVIPDLLGPPIIYAALLAVYVLLEPARHRLA